MEVNSDVIQLKALGSAPYEKYRITFNIRTIISPIPTHREKTVCNLIIPSEYPIVKPIVTVDDCSMPPPWHVNWYVDGRWCEGDWRIEESLVTFIYRCARTIQFHPDYTDARYDAAANKDAIAFWDANKNNRSVIPCDNKNIIDNHYRGG